MSIRVVMAQNQVVLPTICWTCGQRTPVYVVRAGEYRWGLCRRCGYELSHGLREAISHESP